MDQYMRYNRLNGKCQDECGNHKYYTLEEGKKTTCELA